MSGLVESNSDGLSAEELERRKKKKEDKAKEKKLKKQKAARKAENAKLQSWTNESVERDMELIESAVKSLRSLLPPKERYERQTETLVKMMAATGYKDKVPPRIHEENVAKLSKLTLEIRSLSEAIQQH